jgi:phosphoribosylformylglycinamidine synthase
MPPRVLILRAPGTNCDRETAFAFEQAGGRPEIHHLCRILENSKFLRGFQVLVIPGGFSYGDDISAGRIFANQLRHRLREPLEEFKAAGKLILGICNGFQVLVKSGVLLPDRADEPAATLTFNDSGRFEDRWVHLRVCGSRCVFLQGIEGMYLPVAHAEGKFLARDAATLQALDQAGQLALRYSLPPEAEVRGSVSGAASSGEAAGGRAAASEADEAPLPYPANPNGAQRNVAGVCDATGRVFGLMPHPERHCHPTHHPQWTRLDPHLRRKPDGLGIFENAVRYFQ